MKFVPVNLRVVASKHLPSRDRILLPCLIRGIGTTLSQCTEHAHVQRYVGMCAVPLRSIYY